jgi:hypothetical protein
MQHIYKRLFFLTLLWNDTKMKIVNRYINPQISIPTNLVKFEEKVGEKKKRKKVECNMLTTDARTDTNIP